MSEIFGYAGKTRGVLRDCASIGNMGSVLVHCGRDSVHSPGTEAHVPRPRPGHMGKMVELPGTFQSKSLKSNYNCFIYFSSCIIFMRHASYIMHHHASKMKTTSKMRTTPKMKTTSKNEEELKNEDEL